MECGGKKEIVEEINLLTFFLRPTNCDKQPGKNATKATKFATILIIILVYLSYDFDIIFQKKQESI